MRDTAAGTAAQAYVLRVEELLSAVKDVETGQRGYLLLNREEYLEPFAAGVAAVEARLAAAGRARAAAGLGPETGLADLARRRTAIASATVERNRSGDVAGALGLIHAGEGKALMDALRAEADRLQDEALEAASESGRRATLLSRWLGVVSVGGALLACLLLAAYARARRRAERRASALLDGVMTNAPVGLGFLDREARLSGANRALLTMSEEIIGVEAQAGGAAALPPEMRERIGPRLRAVLEGGRAHSEAEVEVTPPGRPEETRHLNMTLFPLPEVQGREEGVGLFVVDVSRRRRAEGRLRRSESRFRSLAESLPQLAFATDAAGDLTWRNRRWDDFAGEGAVPSRGWIWTDLLPLAMAAPVEARLLSFFDAGEAWEDTFPLRAADGAWRWFLVRAVPIREEDDEGADAVSGWFGTCTDVTGMRQAEEDALAAREAAEDANRAKSQFIANMSHELRTPLSAVIGYAEMLEEEAADLPGGETLTDDLRKIGANARHLLSLISDVLDLSKIEAGRMEVHAEDADAAVLVSEVAATVQGLVQRKGNALDLRLADGLGTVHTDPVKLRQCLINLLSNATKFTENGRITLSAARERGEGPDRLRFEVADTGIGMTEEQLGRLFTRFTQADSSTTRRFGGTGLGLAITRAFAGMLGGEISVESEPRRGTRFTLRVLTDLREAEAPPSAPEPERSGPAETAPGAAPAGTVLVVDDDPAARDLLSRFLRREGFAVQCAADGPEGLRLARAHRPTAVLLDVMMPRMDGWAVLSALKADPELAEVPVVMVTIVPERSLAVSLGAAEHLTKPVQWSRLKSVLDRYRSPGTALVVEAEAEARAELARLLRGEGWAVEEAGGEAEALSRLEAGPPVGLVLVAVPGPEGGGLSLIRALRQRASLRDLPLIALGGGAVPAETLEGLRREVRRVVPADAEPPAELLEELRRIAGTRGGPGGGRGAEAVKETG